MTEEYERLPETMPMSGVGIKNLTAKLIVRSENKAIYYRWDGIWEVIRIRRVKASKAFGRDFAAREIYPSSAEFGSLGWSVTSEKEARELYEGLPE